MVSYSGYSFVLFPLKNSLKTEGIQYHVRTNYGKRMTKTQATSALTLNGLRLSVFLGIYPEELSKKQTVTVDIRIAFPQPPEACFSDRLEDTYCYDNMIHYLKEKLLHKKFQMIEHLTQALYALLKAYFPAHFSLSVKVTKLAPNPDLSRGVTFEYGV